MSHSRPLTMSAVWISAGTCRPRCATVDDVFAALDDRGEECGAEQLADPVDVDRPDARDLAHFAVGGAAAHEGAVVDDDVHRRVRVSLGVGPGRTENERGECVGGVGVMTFMFAAFVGPEDALHLGVEPP